MRSVATLLLGLLLTTAAAADSARARMEAFSNGLEALSGDFRQVVTDPNGRRGEASTGHFALEAPRQFRWETTAPFAQLIVADGRRVWIFDPDLEQASVRAQSEVEAQSPLTVLTDLSRLEQSFDTSEAGEREGLLWLRLTPRAEEPEFEYAELGFGASGPERMVFQDLLGSHAEVRFSRLERNPVLPPTAFRFTPPAGVDVVGDPGRDAQVFPVQD